MPKVLFNGEVIAESDSTIQVEGNHYFPPNSVNTKFFTDSNLKTVCGWKGTASYNGISVNGKSADNAVWHYPEPTTDRAQELKGYYAFYKSKVTIE